MVHILLNRAVLDHGTIARLEYLENFIGLNSSNLIIMDGHPGNSGFFVGFRFFPIQPEDMRRFRALTPVTQFRSNRRTIPVDHHNLTLIC